MSLIDISALTFSYDGSYDNIFTNVSFQIDTAWKLGFCGRNGRGKTTFLKLLMGEYEYRGTISASVGFEYFPFEVSDTSLNTLGVFYSIAPNAQDWMIEREVRKLAVNEDVLNRPFATLSSGEQTKMLLAGLFLRENNFLLIDEPTNHLDMSGRETVAKYLNDKTGFILVSHDRAFLDDCVDHILSINKANIEIQRGNFSGWYYNKKMQDDFEQAEDTRLRRDIKRLESAARQSSRWADTAESSKMGKGAAKARKEGRAGKGSKEYMAEKSRKQQMRRKNFERRQQSAIEEKSGLLKNIETADPLKIHPLKYHSSPLLFLENIAVSYEDGPGKRREIFDGLSFSLGQDERLAIMGGNGTGKSSILKLICGEKIPYTGNLKTGTGMIISYVPQDTSFLTGDLRDFTAKRHINEPLFKAILRKLDFSRIQFEKDMRDYSAGQKKKVLIAASLCQQAHVYIWDEPLNYIDILSRMQIEELIKSYKPTMLFVEHDRVFCESVATKTIHMKNQML